MHIRTDRSNAALTRLDLLVIMALALFFGYLFMPALGGSNRRLSRRVTCLSNLKQIGLGLSMYDADHRGFPGYAATNSASNYFRYLAPYQLYPKVFVCPTDTEQLKRASEARNNAEKNSTPFAFAAFGLSYFYGVDATAEQTNNILAGDRHLSTNRQMLPGVLTVTTKTPVSWTKDLHKNGGAFVRSDAGVLFTTNGQLQSQVILSLGTNTTQRFVFPASAGL